ncbi:MAG: tetratricopeptide repeat protein [Methylovulum sp.]|nr:MAG: tetratricopeptide repeat protein [Methylovulum sp.]
MLIFRLLLIVTFVLLGACAGAPEKSPSIEKSSEKPTTPANIAEPKAKTQKLDLKTSIDPDVLFMLLTAELAGQRGQYDIALEGYLEAAKRVKDPRFAERAAMIAMYVKDGSKMNEAVSLWLRQDPGNQTARKLAVLSALRAGDKRAAVGHVEMLLKTDLAGFEKSLLELAGVLQKEGKSALIYEVLDTVSLNHPDQAMVYFVQSLLAMQMDKKELAETKIQQALRIQPGWDKALMFQAQIAVFSGDFNKAETVLRNAALKYPNDGKLKKLLAQVLIKARRYEESIQVYQDIIKDNPADKESRFALALVYLQLNREEQAGDILEELLDDAEWRSQAGFYLGKMEEKHGDVQQALARYDRISDGPLAFDAAVSAISLLAKDKQFAEAASRLRQLPEKYPKQKLRILLLQSELYNQQKQYQKAFDLLTAALHELPDEKDLLYTRALMAERIGKPEIMEADLKKILAKNPDNAEALNALGYTLIDKTKRYAEAERYLKRALELAPDEAVIMDSYGWLQFKLGNMAKALDYLQRAYTKQQENEIAAHLAEVLWVSGQKDEAKKLYKKAIKNAPEDEYLLDFKHRILDKAQ